MTCTLRLWDAATWALLHTLAGHDSEVTSVAFSADSSRIASSSGDHTVRLWDAFTGEHLATLVGHGSSVTSVAFSGDGRRIASVSHDGTVRLWDTTTGQCLQIHWAGTLGTVPSHACWRPPATASGLPEFDKDPATDGGELLSASGDAWRMLAWRVWDDPSAPGQWTQLPLDVYD